MQKRREAGIKPTHRKHGYVPPPCANHPDREARLHGLCQQCADKKRHAADKEKNGAAHALIVKAANLRRCYGMTLDDEAALKKFFPETCCICRVRPANAVDHIHGAKPVDVRGYICKQCNSAIGLLLHSPLAIERAVEYCKNPPLGKDWKQTIHEHRSKG